MLGLLLLVCGAASRAVLSASCSLNVDSKAPEVDVLILGAGITGVTDARTLEVNAITDFLILEAGDRIGGRIREDDGTGLGLRANWIQGLDMRDKPSTTPSGESGQPVTKMVPMAVSLPLTSTGSTIALVVSTTFGTRKVRT